MLHHDPRETADRLEWLRHYQGMSQKEFAKSLEVTPSAYNNWLRDSNGLSLRGARRAKQMYGVSLDFLFFGDTSNLPEQIRCAWEARSQAANAVLAPFRVY